MPAWNLPVAACVFASAIQLASSIVEKAHDEGPIVLSHNFGNAHLGALRNTGAQAGAVASALGHHAGLMPGAIEVSTVVLEHPVIFAGLAIITACIVLRVFAGGKAKWTPGDKVGTLSTFGFIVNMFADLCPPGFLPLAYSLSDTGYVPALVILVTFYGLCVYTMYTIARTSEMTGATTFAGQWERTFGASTSWIPVLLVVMVCFGCNLAYACFYADIFTRLMPSFGLNLPRWSCLLIFTVLPTMPLCLLKDLEVLAPSSAFAVLAVLYTAGIMVMRCLDGTYAPGGHFYENLKPVPEVPKDHLWTFGLGSAMLVNTLSFAFLSHYNGCKYFRELESRNPLRLRRVTAVSMGMSVCLYAVTAVAGFETFGTAADGVVLKNYSRTDWPINVARIAVGLSIIASYPLMFSGLREATVVLLKRLWPQREEEFDYVRFQDSLSIVLVCFITLCAATLSDAGFVVGVVGAVCGSAIIYVIPGALYVAAIPDPENHRADIFCMRAIGVCGCVLALTGLLTTFELTLPM